MHMADALVSPLVGGTMWTVGGVALHYAYKKIKQEKNDKKLPLMGVLGAFVFAAQMINFTIPATGSSGHIGGGLLLAALLGPAAGFTTLAVVLLIQALFFADGGLLAYGCNLINMGFFTSFLAYPLIFKPLVAANKSKGRILLAAVLASVVGLQLGAFSVVLETSFSGISQLPLRTFMLLMQPIHLAIGVVEGVLTAGVLSFVWQAQPLLAQASEDKVSVGKRLVAAFAVAAVLLAGGLSLAASEQPDGLEWSIAGLTGSTEIENSNAWQEAAGAVQELTAFMPDYNLPLLGSSLGASVAGISGVVLTGLACLGLGKMVLHHKNKNVVRG